MLVPPLARAACRPALLHNHLRLRPQHAYLSARVFTSGPLHRKDVHGQRTTTAASNAPLPGSKDAVQQTKAAQPASKNTLLAEQTVTNKEQRKADWAIIKEMSHYLWPKDNLGTRFRVGLSVALLVSAKLLNVQVPFYFKSIVDSMNIDFASLGGTAGTVAGSMIVACKSEPTRPCFSD
jgi:ABC transporter ATM